MSEVKLDRILEMLSALTEDVATLKTDVATLKTDVVRLEKRQDETLAAFREHWKELSGLYRAVRDDLKRFEERVELKLSEVTQSIQALRDSLERQDFRSDELARRITRLEVGDEPSI
jgi:uncharacterized protein YPO0396